MRFLLGRIHSVGVIMARRRSQPPTTPSGQFSIHIFQDLCEFHPRISWNALVPLEPPTKSIQKRKPTRCQMLLRPQSSRRIPRHDCVQRCRHFCHFWKGIATKNHAKWMIYRRLDWKNIGDASLRIPQRCYFLWFCLMMNSWLCIFVKIVWFCLRDNSFLHGGSQYKLSPTGNFLLILLERDFILIIFSSRFLMLLETELILENFRLEKT